jgi:hypothetical protein
MTRVPKCVLLDDPYNQPEEGENVEFRLTYDGPLLATQNPNDAKKGDSRVDHKHAIRKRFHPQLKRLREITPFLKAGHRSGPSALLVHGPAAPKYDAETLAKKFDWYGWNFVPLVTQELDLICGLEILFLRPDRPGELIWAGDIDNRLKTLFDALRVPQPTENYVSRKPESDEQPFFCLLEDDKLITKITVETDQLLEYSSTETANFVRLIITVRLRPYDMTLGNMQFG